MKLTWDPVTHRLVGEATPAEFDDVHRRLRSQGLTPQVTITTNGATQLSLGGAIQNDPIDDWPATVTYEVGDVGATWHGSPLEHYSMHYSPGAPHGVHYSLPYTTNPHISYGFTFGGGYVMQQPPSKKEWTTQLVAEFLDELSPGARAVLHALREALATGLTAAQMERQHVIGTSRSIGPVTGALQRLADKMNVVMPVITSQDGAVYRLDPDFAQVYRYMIESRKLRRALGEEAPRQK